MKRKGVTFFEKVLLVVGIFIVILGYLMIQKMSSLGGGLLSWEAVSSIFLWLISILILILLAANENVKEELKFIQFNQTQELKLIKQELRFLQPKKRK